MKHEQMSACCLLLESVSATEEGPPQRSLIY